MLSLKMIDREGQVSLTSERSVSSSKYLYRPLILRLWGGHGRAGKLHGC